MGNVSQIIRDIKSVRIQGAREVAKAGLKALAITARKSRASSKRKLLQELQSVSGKLVKTRPTEPALRNSLARSLVLVREAEVSDPKKLRGYAARVLESQVKELDSILGMVAEAGSGIIRDGDVILTHCHSHTAVEVMRKAKARGPTRLFMPM